MKRRDETCINRQVIEQGARRSAQRPEPHVLAIASAGGHWVELRRLAKAWEGCRISYVSTNESYRSEIEDKAVREGPPAPRFFFVPDASRWDKAKLLLLAVRIARLVVRLRPDVVISTGAAPGYLAIRIGRLLGARTIWLDSIANVDEVSLSGRLAAPHCTLFLTQWPHLAAPSPSASASMRYAGKVL